MAEDSSNRAFVWFAGLEIALLAVLFVVIAVSVFGEGSFLSAAPRPVRLVALGFVGVETLIPLWVLVDSHRRPEPMDPHWIHATMLPVFNVFGLAAYRWKRRQVVEAASSDGDAEEST